LLAASRDGPDPAARLVLPVDRLGIRPDRLATLPRPIACAPRIFPTLPRRFARPAHTQSNEALVKTHTFIGIMLLALSGSAAASAPADVTATTTAQDQAAIRQVMDSFHHAVATHDGKGVSALFLDHGNTWVTVLSDQGLATMKARKPSVNKVRVGSYQEFADFVSHTTSALDPRHENVRIMSDGAVASVYFHFDFVIDGKTQNWGDETWQLVKTEAGWRIVAISYSSNPAA
jgi:ketosteroid isomerase-like protein